MGAKTDNSTTKYEIVARFEVDGVVEKPDIIGALYGQTDGLLSDDLDIRGLQKTGRIGRIKVNLVSEEGKTRGKIIVPSSLSRVETAIIAAALETVDRVGPCSCKIQLEEIIDVRINKRKAIVDRAAEIIRQWEQNVSPFTSSITLEVEKTTKQSSLVSIGDEGFTAGPAFEHSKKVLLVEGRADVINLLKYGIDNTIAVNGTSVPPKIVELLKDKTVTAFLDGDRGGDLILKELIQVAHVDFVARAPKGREVEDLNKEEILKALENAVPLEKAVFLTGTDAGKTVKEFLSHTKEKKETREKRHEQKKDTQLEAQKYQKPTTIKPKPQVHSKTTKEYERHVPVVKPPEKKHRPTIIKRTPQPKRQPQYPSPTRKIIRKVNLPDKLSATVQEVSKKLQAVVLDEDNNEILRTAASEIYEKLAEVQKASTLIIDGVITQRLLERAYKKGIGMVIGARLGDITKRPATVRIIEFKQV